MKRLAQRGFSLGFTLLELMIALVVIAILAAIAIPAYQGFVERSRRQVAVSVLTDLMAQQRQFELLRRTAALSFADLVGINATTICADQRRRLAVCAAGDPIYEISLSLESGRFVGFEATARGVQLRDTRCARWRVRADGTQEVRSTEDEDSTAECWR